MRLLLGHWPVASNMQKCASKSDASGHCLVAKLTQSTGLSCRCLMTSQCCSTAALSIKIVFVLWISSHPLDSFYLSWLVCAPFSYPVHEAAAQSTWKVKVLWFGRFLTNRLVQQWCMLPMSGLPAKMLLCSLCQSQCTALGWPCATVVLPSGPWSGMFVSLPAL